MTVMRRRACLALMAGASASPVSAISDMSDDWTNLNGWANWKAAFLRPNGRVIDALQQDASHSEGQGYGMLLAAFADDARAFARMHDWTERHLAVRQDPLLAWRWLPNVEAHVSDYNNASDGDLFYAWALLEGSVRFDVPAYRDRAEEIARFLAVSCIRPDPRNPAGRLFLPAAERFGNADLRIINPSYIMPRAMHALSDAFDVSELGRAATDSIDLIGDLARQGPVPDWVEIDADGVRPAQDLPRKSGYDAIRVALYLVWSGRSYHPAVARAAALHMSAGGPETATVFALDGQASQRSSYPGYAAIAALALCADGAYAPIPPADAAQPYYPATLHMLALHAACAGAPKCLPLSGVP